MCSSVLFGYMTSFECFRSPASQILVAIHRNAKDFHTGAPGSRALVWLTNQLRSLRLPPPVATQEERRGVPTPPHTQPPRPPALHCTAQPEYVWGVDSGKSHGRPICTPARLRLLACCCLVSQIGSSITRSAGKKIERRRTADYLPAGLTVNAQSKGRFLLRCCHWYKQMYIYIVRSKKIKNKINVECCRFKANGLDRRYGWW